jgi:FAD synthase
LRDEQRFKSLDELKRWIERDIADSRLFFGQKSHARATDSL